MGNFTPGKGGNNRGGFRPGGRPSFQKKSWGGDRDSRDSGGQGGMHKAQCADCGKDCEVPFRPYAGRPVFCSDCFSKKEETYPGQAAKRDARDSRDSRDRSSSSAKPSFAPAADNTEVTKQLEGVNQRLDRVIRAIETLTRLQVAQASSAATDFSLESPEISNESVVSKKAPKAKPAKKKATKKA
jgi:CxxC-x17-CxxC domain-containing protein